MYIRCLYTLLTERSCFMVWKCVCFKEHLVQRCSPSEVFTGTSFPCSLTLHYTPDYPALLIFLLQCVLTDTTMSLRGSRHMHDQVSSRRTSMVLRQRLFDILSSVVSFPL